MSGRCSSCPEGNQGCPCLASGACAGTLQCVGGTCLDCVRGSEGCRCYSNATCDGTLICTSDICAPCTPGSLGCRCDQGVCDGDLVCGSDDMCAPRPCPAGELGCACDGGSCAQGLYCTGASLCAACVDDVVGCPCTLDTCSGGLVCDPGTDLCRQPLRCAAATCVEHQRCEELPGHDATCLLDCEAGYFWASPSQSGQATRPNCEPGAEGSILAVCEALWMHCLASSSGATCDGCVDGSKPVDAAAPWKVCRLPWTCAERCTTAGRACTSEGLLEGCIGDNRCVEGSCIPRSPSTVWNTGATAVPFCASELDCPDLQTCIQGHCYSDCERDADCAPGLACSRMVCRAPCLAGGAACPDGMYCELGQSASAGFCSALGSTLDGEPVAAGERFALSSLSLALSPIQATASLRVFNAALDLKQA